MRRLCKPSCSFSLIISGLIWTCEWWVQVQHPSWRSGKAAFFMDSEMRLPPCARVQLVRTRHLLPSEVVAKHCLSNVFGGLRGGEAASSAPRMSLGKEWWEAACVPSSASIVVLSIACTCFWIDSGSSKNPSKWENLICCSPGLLIALARLIVIFLQHGTW